MFQEILGKLSGGQITAIALAAVIFVPGALGGAVVAAVTFQPVAIVDPTTGKQSFVDGTRKLWVYDPIAGYRNNPANLVEISVSNYGVTCESTQQYTVPAGKALVLTAVSGFEQQYNTSNYAGYAVWDASGCTGAVIHQHASSVGSANPRAPIAVDLGAGVVVKAGHTVSVQSNANFGYTYLHGYLIPSAAAPAMVGPEAVSQPASITAAEVEAKTKKLAH